MLKKFPLTLSAGFFASMFLASCLEGPTGPAGPALSGSLSGYVTLVNANGVQPAVKDSVQVTLEGSAQSTMTDSTGKWTLSDLKTGTYTLNFSKSGYGMSKSIQLQFTGGSEKNLGTTFLCAPPTFSVANLASLGISNSRVDSSSVYLGVTLSDSTITGPYRIYLVLAPDSNLSAAPTLRSIGSFNPTNFTNGTDTADIRLTPAGLAATGFAPGDTIYAAAYTANAGGNNSGYLDTLTGKTLFTNINTHRSNILKIAIPKFSGQPQTGNINGSVILVKANGDQHVERDKVEVSIDGTDISTLSDSSGNWSLPGIKNGSYSLTFTKSGYGISKMNVNLLNSNKNVGTTYLCQAPSFTVTDLSQLAYGPARNDSASIYLAAKLSDSAVQGLYRIYLVLSLDSNPSTTLNPDATGTFFNVYFRKGENNTDLHLTPTILAGAGFQSGDTLYAEAFSANAGGINSSYPDSLTGKPVFTNLNPKGSNALKFVVP